jgi:hypothetical protein
MLRLLPRALIRPSELARHLAGKTRAAHPLAQQSVRRCVGERWTATKFKESGRFIMTRLSRRSFAAATVVSVVAPTVTSAKEVPNAGMDW